MYNVHGLVHIAEDVKLFGPLDAYSAFPFENFLSRLKRLVSSPRYPLQQVIKRLSEMKSNNLYFKRKSPLCNEIPMKRNLGPLPLEMRDAQQFQQINSNNLFFSVTAGNNCIQVKGSICLIRNILVPVNTTDIVFSS